MSDTTPTVKKFRDHSEECEHGYTNEHVTKDLPEGYNPDEYTGKWWTCPGGRERTFRRFTRLQNDTGAIRVEGGVWVEVTDEM